MFVASPLPAYPADKVEADVRSSGLQMKKGGLLRPGDRLVNFWFEVHEWA